MCDWFVFLFVSFVPVFVDECEVVLCAPFYSACFICHLIRFDVMCVMRYCFFRFSLWRVLSVMFVLLGSFRIGLMM